MTGSTDRIERSVTLKASRSRVWRALSHAEELTGSVSSSRERASLRVSEFRGRSRIRATNTWFVTC